MDTFAARIGRIRARDISATAAVVLALTLVAAACSPATEQTSGDSAPGQEGRTKAAATPAVKTIEETKSGYQVDIDPGDFVRRIDNPYFPLEPGTEWVLEGESDEGQEVDTIKVLEETKEVMGVATTVVLDVVTVNGELQERTWDWYAQDRQGNVWYFGENTAEYEDGEKVSSAGAWKAGADGALPGIIMNADPQVTDSFRQEYYEGEAEDMYWVVATDVAKEVPYRMFEDAIRTVEWTPLEPKVVAEKYYAPGVGLIAEKALAGEKETFELVKTKRP